jgi:hypothetical protein
VSIKLHFQHLDLGYTIITASQSSTVGFDQCKCGIERMLVFSGLLCLSAPKIYTTPYSVNESSHFCELRNTSQVISIIQQHWVSWQTSIWGIMDVTPSCSRQATCYLVSCWSAWIRTSKWTKRNGAKNIICFKSQVLVWPGTQYILIDIVGKLDVLKRFILDIWKWLRIKMHCNQCFMSFGWLRIWFFTLWALRI